MENNLIITDIMGYANGKQREGFISKCTIPEQSFTFEWFYYNWRNYDLKKFKRKFACVDVANNFLSTEYQEELVKKIEILTNENFIIVLSNLWESRESSLYLKKNKEILNKFSKKIIDLNGDDCFFWSMMHDMYFNKTLNFNHQDKKFDFLYLNKLARTHRKKLYDLLDKNAVLDNSLYSFLDSPYFKKLPVDYELPWVDRENYPWVGFDQQIYEKPYNDSGVSIVTESIVNGDEIFLTEKIWKPIIAGQPFVVHGQCGYLKHLKKLGFKTYENYWDESYDNESNFDKRTSMLVDLIKCLKNYDWKKFYEESAIIRKHNIENFFNKSKLNDLINLKMSRLLEFADRG